MMLRLLRMRLLMSDDVNLDVYRNSQRCILTDLILESFDLGRFVVVDVGADIFNQPLPNWINMLHNKITIHSFEVIEEQRHRYNELAKLRGIDVRYHPWAITDGRAPEQTFYLTRASGGSGFYMADQNVVGPLALHWDPQNRDNRSFAEALEPVEIFQFPTISLDDWCAREGINEIDFIKINAQGSEYDILSAGRKTMATALGAQVELQLCRMYEGARIFGDTHLLLDEMGLTFFDSLAPNFVGYLGAGVYLNHNSVRHMHPRKRIFEGHFLFLRELLCKPFDLDTLSVTRTLKLVCIAEIFGHFEYAFALARALSQSTSDKALSSMLGGIMRQADARLAQILSPPKPA
jgi:FkbM family methyltransferase